MLEVRPARDDEMTAVVGLLARAAFGAAVGRLVAFPRESPHGEVLVASLDGRRVHGAACCASFGASGWIGALAVSPPMRRRGIGRALTEAGIVWLRERGAHTVLLFATAMGRPVYERLGFDPEGTVTAWRGNGRSAPPPEGIALRALSEGDRADCRVLDRAATGEARDPVLEAMRPLHGVAAAAPDGALRGFAAVSPWGVGTSISALDERAGVALMGAATAAAGGPAAVLVVPDANRAATAALRQWRFVPANEGLRMRLGPPVPWRPEHQFGLFNLFWG